MGSINYLQAIKPDTAYLKKIIESSLLADWAISIEYQSNDSEANDWQLWGTASFAIRTAKPVLAALLECYTKHPTSAIRIRAEKFHPQTCLLHTVYNPGDQLAETMPGHGLPPRQSAPEYKRAAGLTRIVA